MNHLLPFRRSALPLFFTTLLAIALIGLAACSNPSSGSGEDPIVTEPGITVAAPAFTVGNYGFYQTVSISAAAGTAIHYTTDGSTPTTGSKTYSAAINVSGWGVTKTIKAIAFQSGSSSAVASQTAASTTLTIMMPSTVSTFAGAPGQASKFLDAAGTAARFNVMCGICTDGSYLYVADYNNNMIRRIGMSTAEVKTYCSGTAIWKTCTTTTDADIQTISTPIGIATDGVNLYVSSEGAHKIYQIDLATGTLSTLAGTGASGMADGIGSSATFGAPNGICTDGSNVYVADWENCNIRKIVLATGVVSTLAGSGLAGSADGTGSAATFYYPCGLATDGANLYVADNHNMIIRRIAIASGAVTTIAGTADTMGSTDGAGSVALFSSNLRHLVYDGNHSCLYIADNDTVRVLSLPGNSVSTLAGSAVSSGTADGTTTAARFQDIFGITTDGSRVFLVDQWNFTVRNLY